MTESETPKPPTHAVSLTSFSGPLDLLLFLVKQSEVDIMNIPIADITEQYLEHLKLLKELDINFAGEFLVMASTLMLIKSRMLLPQEVGEDETEIEDPRQELVHQLLEYQRYKEASFFLEDSYKLHEKKYSRMQSAGEDDHNDESSTQLNGVEIWDLVTAFSRLMKETMADKALVIFDDQTSIETYMKQILDRLAAAKTISFVELFESTANRNQIIGVFLALLELIRMTKIRVQGYSAEEIQIMLAVSDCS